MTRKYYHPDYPKEGDNGVYYERGSFEADKAMLFGAGGALVASVATDKAKSKSALPIVALAAAGLGGLLVPRRILSWYDPPPYDPPKVYPTEMPPLMPSRIGDKGQVLNLLPYNGAGSVLKDYSEHGNDGQIHGAEWKEDRGWSLGFTEGDYVDCGNNASLQIAGSFSVLIWVLLKDDTKFGWAFGKGYGYKTPVGFTFGNHPKVLSQWWGMLGGGGEFRWGRKELNRRICLGIVYNEEAEPGRRLDLYQDGMYGGSGDPHMGYLGPHLANEHPLYIGSDPLFPYTWPGSIYQTLLYDYALSFDEVKEYSGRHLKT